MTSSKDVNKEIRRIVWPALKEAGFTEFTARSAWRRHAFAIDVLNFQSFNSYFASVDGCTTFSFGIELGVYYPPNPKVPWRRELMKPKIAERPAGYDCPARHSLRKTIRQPHYKRKDIWYVEPSGKNIVEVVVNARNVILSRGIPWFDDYDDPRRALDHYLKSGNNSLMASNGSIAAALDGGALAVALGDKSAARHLWEAVIRGYAGDADVIRKAKKRIAQIDALKI
ncbi:MAG TPA: DUF4304 domain-containing protein [Humisphaera sp.]|nr:DUF4304 domain-containing protein [Humisphaera sp.]